MAYLTAEEIVSGREGKVIVNIDGKIREAAEIKSLTASVELTKNTFNVIGKNAEQTKNSGWKGTGTMSMYASTTTWHHIVSEYTKNSKVVYFSIVVTNEDPSTRLGKQRIQLNNCSLDGMDIINIDADTDFLTRDISFTFDDFIVLDSFDQVVGLS